MVKFNAIIKKFAKHKEKTGWTYIVVPEKIAQKMKPGNRKGYRVKGKLDNFEISGIALIPLGEGNFILTLNANTRKGIRKIQGDTLKVVIEPDDEFDFFPSAEFLECLKDESPAYEFFLTLTKSHQGYFIKWIDSAKTDETKAKRIANTIEALISRQSYGEMLRKLKNDREQLLG